MSVNIDMKNPSTSHPIVLEFYGMTPSNLGPDLFQRVLHCTRRAVEIYAGQQDQPRAFYDPETHEKLGYRVVVADRLTAMRIRLAHDLARQCRAMPWVK